MKKVINRKMYNTKTAEILHEWDNGIYGNDFRSCEETLYVTKKGNYFLHGKGGAMTEYAESHGNSVSEGSEIIPLTLEEVLTWLEEHDGADVIEERFQTEIEEAQENEMRIGTFEILPINEEYFEVRLHYREGDIHGIRSGWFFYPYLYDPVWKEKDCKNYKEE